MIEFKEITFTYKKGRQPALSDINATAGTGLYLLAGENGAGKTTLLHVTAGLLHPQQGVCLIDGVKATTTNPAEMGQVFLLEENMHIPGKSIRKFAEIHSQFYPTFSEERFTENLRIFGHTGDEPLRSLSLGNKKKAQLAYVLALGTKVLLLDEPTNALDIEGRELFRRMLTESMTPEQTVIVATHTVNDLEKLFDGALIMKGSHLVYSGTQEDVASKLAFINASDADPNALYSENQMGHFLNIYPATEGRETRVDWKSLYMALHSSNSQKLISHLQK